MELIQDLNGNHVIQKCLNRLKGDDAQVSTNGRTSSPTSPNIINSSSSMLLASIVFPLAPIAMAAAFFNVASTTPLENKGLN